MPRESHVWALARLDNILTLLPIILLQYPKLLSFHFTFNSILVPYVHYIHHYLKFVPRVKLYYWFLFILA